MIKAYVNHGQSSTSIHRQSEIGMKNGQPQFILLSTCKPRRLKRKRTLSLVFIVLWCLVIICSARHLSSSFRPLIIKAHVVSDSEYLDEQSTKVLDLPRSGISAAALNLEKCIRRGTFAFLVQGEGIPSAFWIEVSHLNNTRVIWLSWKTEVPRVSLPSTLQDVHFLPGSSFTIGRNKLWKQAQETEARQHWCFEYVIFCDEDVAGLTVLRNNAHELGSIPNLAPNKSAGLSTPVKAIVLLEHLLLSHSPARAGVAKQDYPQPRWGRCDNCCYQDACLEAFHRTAVHHLLPYVERYDAVSAWMSAAIMNLLSDLIIAPYCMVFNDIMVMSKTQKHNKYPRNVKGPDLYPKGLHHISLFHNSSVIRARAKNITNPKHYKPKCSPLQCFAMPRTMNYFDLLEETLHEES